MLLYGLEIARKDRSYQWDVEVCASNYYRVTLFGDAHYQDLSEEQISTAVIRELSVLRPVCVVVSGWASAEALGALRWCARKEAPAVLMSASTAHDYRRPCWKEFVKRRIVARFGAALVGGTPQKEYLVNLGMSPHKVFKGYNAVDNAYFAERAQRMRDGSDRSGRAPGLPRNFFLFAGRLIPVKNLPKLLQAYAAYRLAVGRDPWSLVICGSGGLEKQLKSLAGDLELRDVLWPGFVQKQHLAEYYGCASALILPSIKDTWGLVVNEAMASGLPVLVSARAGCRYDLVRDGVNGWVFDPYDVQDIMRKMLAMSKLGQDRRLAMGRASRQIISTWGPERFALGLVQAVEAAVEAANRPGGKGVLAKLVLKLASSPLARRIERQ